MTTAQGDPTGPPLTFSVWIGGIIRRWALIAKVLVLTVLLAAVAAVTLPPVYRSEASFFASSTSPSKIPQGMSAPGLSGIASQLGVGAMGTDPSESPNFYVQLIESRELRTRLALSRFPDPRTENPQDSAQFVDLLGIDAKDPQRKLEIAVKKIDKLIGARSDLKTNLVWVDAKARWADVSASLANRTIELVNGFNREQRTSRARSKRVFLQNRLDSAYHELRRAEETQRSFYDQNRQWRNSPSLTYEEARLTRNVNVATDLYLQLQRQFEAARLDEFNDAALITVVDSAVSPRKAEWPRYWVLLATSLATGTILGTIVAGSATILDDWGRRNPASASFLRESWVGGPFSRRRRRRSTQVESAAIVR